MRPQQRATIVTNGGLRSTAPVSDLWRFLRACAGGLLAASVLFPGMAGVSAVTMDLADWPHGWSGAARFFFATGLAAAALVPLAVPFRRFATADRSNPA